MLLTPESAVGVLVLLLPPSCFPLCRGFSPVQRGKLCFVHPDLDSSLVPCFYIVFFCLCVADPGLTVYSGFQRFLTIGFGDSSVCLCTGNPDQGIDQMIVHSLGWCFVFVEMEQLTLQPPPELLTLSQSGISIMHHLQTSSESCFSTQPLLYSSH